MKKIAKWSKKLFGLCAISLISLTLWSEGVYAAPTAPTLTLPLDGSKIPYYQTFLKWNDVTNEHHYLISVRDLTTDTLIRNRVTVAQNSVYYSILSNELVKGHQYRWTLASVDTAGVESWAPTRTFTIESSEPHVWSGGYTSASHLDFWVSDGGNTSYGDNILQAGGEMWNGATSYVYAHRDWNTTDYEVGIVRSSSATPGNYGLTVNYSGGTRLSDSDTTSTWDWTEIYIYENNLAADGFSDVQKRAVVGHEMGHALSLGHTIDLWTTEIMDQGIGKSTTTTDIDRTHLRIKWGWL